jgi:hypothetical protein
VIDDEQRFVRQWFILHRAFDNFSDDVIAERLPHFGVGTVVAVRREEYIALRIIGVEVLGGFSIAVELIAMLTRIDFVLDTDYHLRFGGQQEQVNAVKLTLKNTAEKSALDIVNLLG